MSNMSDRKYTYNATTQTGTQMRKERRQGRKVSRHTRLYKRSRGEIKAIGSEASLQPAPLMVSALLLPLAKWMD
jgi:hypothetical protein